MAEDAQRPDQRRYLLAARMAHSSRVLGARHADG